MKLTVMLLFISINIFAMEAEIPGGSNKVKIKADRGSFKQKENMIELFDNVSAVDEKMTITCEKMTVELLVKGAAESEARSRKARTITAEKNVIIKDEKMTAYGDRGKYEVAKKTLYLTGNARIEQRDSKTGSVNVYRGRVIIYNTETRQIDIKGMNADVAKEGKEPVKKK